MSSPEERQMSICLRMYDLEEIENEFKSQYLVALPYLDAELQQQCLKMMSTLREARAAHIELENLKLKNNQLKAQQIQMRRESNEAHNMAMKMQQKYAEYEQLIEQEKNELNQYILQDYDEKVMEQADRYRQTAGIYDEEKIKQETDKANKVLSDLLAVQKIRQQELAESKKILDNMKNDAPENILEIMGKQELEEKLNSLK